MVLKMNGSLLRMSPIEYYRDQIYEIKTTYDDAYKHLLLVVYIAHED